MAWLAAKVTSPPTSGPVTVEEVRQRCRIDSDEDDADINEMIREACDHVERYCNLRICPQQIELRCDGFSDFSRLPVGPANAVTSVAYVDVAGSTQVLPDSVYEMIEPIELEQSIILKSGQNWPQIQPSSRVTVVVEAGFYTVPPAIRGAIFVYVAARFERREDAPAEGRTTFDLLLSNFRRG